MNKLGKLLLITFSLLLLFLLTYEALTISHQLAFLPANVRTIPIINFVIENKTIHYIILTTTIALLLITFIFFIVVLFSKTTVRQLVIKKDGDSIIINKNALETSMLALTNDIPACIDPKLKIKLYRKKIEMIVYFTCHLSSLELLSEFEAIMRERINDKVQSLTGNNAKKIIIRVTNEK